MTLPSTEQTAPQPIAGLRDLGGVPQRLARFLGNPLVRGLPRDQQKALNVARRRRMRRLAWFLVPMILAIRLIRPLVLIRFGRILQHKIGHCPLEAELYLLERAAGLQPRRTLDFFFFDYGTDGLPANGYAAYLARRSLRLHPLVEVFHHANKLVPGAAAHRVRIRSRDNDLGLIGDCDGLLAKVPVQIDFTAEEERLGQQLLRRMGIPDGAPFVCFNVREQQYWLERKPDIDSASDFRNADVATYYDAMRIAAERGCYVLRLGASVSAPLPAIHPRVIDYASQWRNEFMDVYLAARCRLMVSTASGVDAISFFHRRPILFTNLVHWERVSPSYAPPCRALLKLYRRDERIMTVDEIAGSGVQLRCHTTEDFRRENIEFIDNTPGDIVDGVREMLDLLDGHADAPTAHEEAIYDRMAGRIRQRVPSALTPVRVAASFVRRHPELFLS